MQARYEAAPSFHEFLSAVQANADLWRAVYARARVPDALVARVRALGRRLHLLVLSEDWCGDAVNTVPLVAKLAERSGTLDVRLLARDRNPDIMDAHLTGASRSIPVVILLDETFRECGWWGPRPTALQQWVLGPGQELPMTDRYREIRRWYARDLGVSTLDEIVSLLERGAKVDAGDARSDGRVGG